MKKAVINHWMFLIKKNKNYDDNKLAEIKYGLTAIYLTLSKSIIIFFIAILLGIFKEMIIFVLLYNILRMPSFGIHATKSWICLILSAITFIGFPLLCKYIYLNIILKTILGIMGCIFMLKNSPADTKKRPIVNPKRRLIYKTISTGFALIFFVSCLITNNNFLSNCLLFSLILQNILISPLTYKIFKQPYDNYKEFLKINPNFLN